MNKCCIVPYRTQTNTVSISHFAKMMNYYFMDPNIIKYIRYISSVGSRSNAVSMFATLAQK